MTSIEPMIQLIAEMKELPQGKSYVFTTYDPVRMANQIETLFSEKIFVDYLEGEGGMRIIVVSDSHGLRRELREVREKYPLADAYLHLGDSRLLNSMAGKASKVTTIITRILTSSWSLLVIFGFIWLILTCSTIVTGF